MCFYELSKTEWNCRCKDLKSTFHTMVENKERIMHAYPHTQLKNGEYYFIFRKSEIWSSSASLVNLSSAA